MEKITSAANPAVKRLKALSDAKGRKEQGAFLVEGEVMVREALASGLNPLESPGIAHGFQYVPVAQADEGAMPRKLA